MGSPLQPLIHDPLLKKPNAGLYASEFWGISRHEAIAGAAEIELTEKAKMELSRIVAVLGDGVGLSSLAGWADRIKRRRPQPGDDPDTLEFLEDERNITQPTWHYVNIPAGADGYDRTKYPKFTRDEDVVQMTAHAVNVLIGASDRFSELNALRLVTHLVGDVHQPIHVGCGYVDRSGPVATLVLDPMIAAEQNLRHDRGGNSLLLPIGANGRSLHSYWDSMGAIDDDGEEQLQDAGGVSPEIKVQFIQKLAAMVQHAKASEPAANHLAPLPVDQWAKTWATESLADAHKAYQSLVITGPSGTSTTNFRVGWEGQPVYDARCKPIANQRLTAAVRHLAALLNEIWK